MNRIVVVYQSRYGTTKKYAEWIARLLGADLRERKKTRIKDLNDYGIVIYGGGLYANGVSGIELIAKNFEKLDGKQIILFTVGVSDPHNEANVSHIREGIARQLPAQAAGHIRIFHFRGGIDYNSLSVVHRAMMGMLKKMLEKKQRGQLTEEDKQLLATFGKKVDFADEASIIPLVDYVGGLRPEQ